MNCSPECVNIGCSPPDWLERHSTFLLTLVGVVGTGAGVLLTYFLKSRCEEIKCACIYCKRKVLEPRELEIK